MPAQSLAGKKVAMLAADGVEQVELTAPRQALEEAGATVELISTKPGEIQGVNHLDKGDAFRVDRVVSDANVDDYAALVIPGGVANPDFLRTDAAAVRFVRAFVEADKPVAAICHGPWLLVEADVVRGRTLTSWPSLQTDIRNAGGEWVDKKVVADQKLVTSRNPDDLPAFNAKLVELLSAAAAEGALDRMVEMTFPASDPVAVQSPVAGVGSTPKQPTRPEGGAERRASP